MRVWYDLANILKESGRPKMPELVYSIDEIVFDALGIFDAVSLDFSMSALGVRTCLGLSLY